MLETDASSDGLGAILLQEGKDGKLHPIAYGRQSLTKAERNYHLGKTKFLTLKWVITDPLYALKTMLPCSNSVSLKSSMRHAGKMYLNLVNKNDIMNTALVLWC